MAYMPLRVTSSAPPTAGFQRPSVPVILDCGEHARVVTVTFSRLPQVGERFVLEGSTWEIVRAKDLLRGYVARAVAPGLCVH